MNWTYAQIRSKIITDLNLGNERSVSDAEIRGYVNEGISQAESYIHKLGRDDDYFLTSFQFNSIPGQELYPLPLNIYANKIRALNVIGATGYRHEIKRITQRRKFIQAGFEDGRFAFTPYQFVYYLYFSPGQTTDTLQEKVSPHNKIKLIPTPKDVHTFELYYLAEANKLSDDNDVCNIPEFIYFVLFYAKHQIALKEQSDRIPFLESERNMWRDNMVSTLTEQVDDGADDINEDLTSHVNQAFVGSNIYPVIRGRNL